MNENDFEVIGKKQARVDGVKLALGRASFTDDFDIPGMLHARVLRSPHAHARIRHIDSSGARALPGVHAVLTHAQVPRVLHSPAGQGYPEPSPYDAVMLDTKVRFVGDRVAVVAAESPEIADRAIGLIAVDYEELPAILDPRQSMAPGAPVIHDEKDCSGVYDATRNVAAHLEATVGNPVFGFGQADRVLEREYSVQYVQQSSIEPHITISYLDEDNRLIFRSSTQVPFHARRILANVLQLPIRRIRVIKPRIGGGFGGKQEVLIEDLCGALTLATKRPVRLEYTRAEELYAARTRHPQILTVKMGANLDGSITAISLKLLENTGAYGSHCLTVQSVTGSRTLALYDVPHLRFEAHAVYTNLPVAGAFRGYGAPQGFFALESIIDEMALELDMDPLVLRKKNLIREGQAPKIAEVLAEGKSGYRQVVNSCGLDRCIEKGLAALQDENHAPDAQTGPIRRGRGMACVMQASGIPGIDMGAASLKMNEDGSFNLMVGATDLGTGSDTMLAQIAAEALSVSPEDVLVYSSDTDFTPFDTGAYASSTTFISGGAVKKAADQVRQQILAVASEILESESEKLICNEGRVFDPRGKSVSYGDICCRAFYQEKQHQIMAVASHMSYDSPPPFGAQFAEVEVDIETGLLRVLRFVSAIDCGQVINPQMAEGQIEGAVTQGIGYATSEAMPLDESGRMQALDFRDYNIYTAVDMPELKTIFVHTHEPAGPYGAKALAEIPINGPAPAIANAVYAATGVRIRDLPITAEKILNELSKLRGDGQPAERRPVESETVY